MKKAKHQRTDAFELWCWRRLLRVPWTTWRSNQSILQEINSEYSLERLMLKLKLQYFGHLMWRADSLEKTLMLGNIEDRRRRWLTEEERVGWHHRLNGHEFEQTSGDSEGQRSLACCSPWGCRVGLDFEQHAGSLLLDSLLSSWGWKGMLSSCSGRASHYSGFSCYGAQTVGCSGISSCGLWAQ